MKRLRNKMKKLRNKDLIIIGSIILVLSVILTFILQQGVFLFFALGGMALANYSGSQENRKRWNHGICKMNNEPWEFDKVVEYTETFDLCFKSGENSLLIPIYDVKKKEYKGKEKW